MKTASFAIRCTEKTTGKVGDFLYVEDFKAISPIFDHFGLLTNWMRENGWEIRHYTKGDPSYYPNRCEKVN